MVEASNKAQHRQMLPRSSTTKASGVASAASAAPAAAPSLSSSYPSFALPVIKAIVPATTTPTTTALKNNDSTATTTAAADKERIKCAESFRKHIHSVNRLDLAAMSRFISTYGAISDDGNSSTNNKITTSSAAMTTETEKKTCDPSRLLFPTEGKKRILSELSANEEDYGKRLVKKPKYAVEEKDGEDDDDNNDDGSDDIDGG